MIAPFCFFGLVGIFFCNLEGWIFVKAKFDNILAIFEEICLWKRPLALQTCSFWSIAQTNAPTDLLYSLLTLLSSDVLGLFVWGKEFQKKILGRVWGYISFKFEIFVGLAKIIDSFGFLDDWKILSDGVDFELVEVYLVSSGIWAFLPGLFEIKF